MLPEMESPFSFKTANLSWKKALLHRLSKKVRDCLDKDSLLRTQADIRVGDITMVTISGWYTHFTKSLLGQLCNETKKVKNHFLVAKNEAKDEYVCERVKCLVYKI